MFNKSFNNIKCCQFNQTRHAWYLIKLNKDIVYLFLLFLRFHFYVCRCMYCLNNPCGPDRIARIRTIRIWWRVIIDVYITSLMQDKFLTHIISAWVYTCNYRSSDATPSIHMTQIDKPVNSKRPPKSPDNWSDAKEHVHIVKTAVKYVVIRHGIRSPPPLFI